MTRLGFEVVLDSGGPWGGESEDRDGNRSKAKRGTSGWTCVRRLVRFLRFFSLFGVAPLFCSTVGLIRPDCTTHTNYASRSYLAPRTDPSVHAHGPPIHPPTPPQPPPLHQFQPNHAVPSHEKKRCCSRACRKGPGASPRTSSTRSKPSFSACFVGVGVCVGRCRSVRR